MVMSVAGPTHPSRLFHIYDRNSNTRFLVDTGADVSVIPSTCIERSHSPSPCFLQGVDGSQIATYGVHSCTLNIGLRRTFRWVFTIANVKQAILGADFLHHFGLVVDMHRRVLLDSNTHIFLFMAFFLTPLRPFQALFDCSWTLLTPTSPTSLSFLR